MSLKHAFYTMIALTAAVLIYSLVLYPSLPDKIPGWGDKRWATFLLPGMMALLAVFLAVPIFSPRIEVFEPTYYYVIVLITVRVGFQQILMLHAALHPDADIGRALWCGRFIYLALLGNVMGKIRRNDCIGILTPWTLASDAVWVGTHRLAGRLMVAVSIVGAIAVWAGAPVGVCLWLYVATLLWPAIYSYILYRRLEGNGPG
jgi:uncharacterized membrane protein